MHKNKTDDKNIFGFWVYLMTDLIMFAALFAAFAVLRNSTFGGPSGDKIFSLPFVLTETIILLISSFSIGLAILSAQANKKTQAILFLLITFVLGVSFLAMELIEFSHLIHDGATFQRSAFLSSYFTLVGTHGLHITAGLFWMGILCIQILRHGLINSTMRKLTLLSLFWHFLDIVWIFIFTIVYLIGVL